VNVTDTVSSRDELIPRPMRADARRNRERIVRAAREVFAQYGRDAQMDDVARRAKVGVGTVYRHFPTKEALFEALIEDKFLRLKAIVEEHANAEDGGAAFDAAMWRFAELMAEDRALHSVLQDLPHAEYAERSGLRPLADGLLERAKAAGALRPDFTVDDIPVVMCGAGSAIQMVGGDTERFRRYFARVLDGLRPGAAA